MFVFSQGYSSIRNDIQFSSYNFKLCKCTCEHQQVSLMGGFMGSIKPVTPSGLWNFKVNFHLEHNLLEVLDFSTVLHGHLYLDILLWRCIY